MEDENASGLEAPVGKPKGKINDVEDFPGIGAATAKKLKDAGYDSVETIAYCLPSELEEVGGVGKATAVKIINIARDAMEMGFETGDQVLERRKTIEKISTGSKELDTLLGGHGLETQAITEAYGKFGSSKCVAPEEFVAYMNDDEFYLDPISEIYEKYAARFGQEPCDDGAIVKAPCIRVFAFNDRGITREVPAAIYKGYADELVEVNTKRGRALKVTKSHKLLIATNDGLQWKPAAEIVAGDSIACPRATPVPTTNSMSEDDAYFLGLFTAEGTANPLSISTSEPVLRDWLCGYISRRFGYEPTVRERRLAGRKPVYTVLFRVPTVKLLSGLEKTKSSTKFVPSKIFTAGEKTVKSFLAGYLDGDGCLGLFTVSATTKSSRLARELAYLFSSIGISATWRHTRSKSWSYIRLSITGFDRDSLSQLPLKTKATSITTRTGVHGFPRAINKLIKRFYKQTMGGNRGRQEKEYGKKNNGSAALYCLFTMSPHQQISASTMAKVMTFFQAAEIELSSMARQAKTIPTMNRDEFKRFATKLPFALNTISTRLGIARKSVANYATRKLPDNRKQQVADAISCELENRAQKSAAAVVQLKIIASLCWDTATSTQIISHNAPVYDFVVPEGHTFVGGTMPTIFHNTQIGFQLCVNAQLPPAKGGVEGNVLFIDTESTFRPERVAQMAAAKGLDTAEVLKNIHVAKATNSDHQMLLLEKAEPMLREKNIKLVIIDSLTAAFRSDYIGRGELAERQQKLNRHLHTLLRYCDRYNVAGYVTNQVLDRPDILFGDPTAPIGGHVVGHNSTYRLYLRRSKEDRRIAKLVDSPNLPDGECVFRVTPEGICD